MQFRYGLALTVSFVLCLHGPVRAAAQKTATADGQVVGADEPTSPAALVDAAWTRLNDGLNGTKNTDTRIAAIAGLSLLGGFARAETLVRDTMHDPDIDVRLAALVAAGEMGKSQGAHSTFATDLRNQLDDPDPKVAFTAASTLWKLNDPSGEDILAAVAEGERSAEYSFWKNSKHTANRTLHSPSALAKIGAQQGLLILVPPVGIGMGAYGYLKGAGGASPQVVAITQLAKDQSEPAKQALIQATKAKEAGARVAAAEALAQRHGAEVRDALRPLLTDGKENVRFTGSAAYIRVVSGVAAPATAAPKSR